MTVSNEAKAGGTPSKYDAKRITALKDKMKFVTAASIARAFSVTKETALEYLKRYADETGTGISTKKLQKGPGRPALGLIGTGV